MRTVQPAVRTALCNLPSVESCARRFNVSSTAMQWRLHAFALASSPPEKQAPRNEIP